MRKSTCTFFVHSCGGDYARSHATLRVNFLHLPAFSPASLPCPSPVSGEAPTPNAPLIPPCEEGHLSVHLNTLTYGWACRFDAGIPEHDREWRPKDSSELWLPFDYDKHFQQPLALLLGGYIGMLDVTRGTSWHQGTAEAGPSHYRMWLAVGSRRERRRTPRDQWLHSTVSLGVACLSQ